MHRDVKRVREAPSPDWQFYDPTALDYLRVMNPGWPSTPEVQRSYEELRKEAS